jgi:hypothetical protein
MAVERGFAGTAVAAFVFIGVVPQGRTMQEREDRSRSESDGDVAELRAKAARLRAYSQGLPNGDDAADRLRRYADELEARARTEEG